MKGGIDMTDFEMLQAILDEIKGIKKEVREIKEGNKVIHAKLDNLENRFDNLEKEVKLNAISTETILKLCFKLYSDGCADNRKRIDADSMDIRAMQGRINDLEMQQIALEYKITRI